MNIVEAMFILLLWVYTLYVVFVYDWGDKFR